MSLKIWIPILVLALFAAAAIFVTPCTGGEVPLTSGYKVLPPIRHGNLTVFPVAAASSTKVVVLGVAMAQTAVRARAMSDKDQAKVWSEVRNAQAGVASRLPAAAASEVAGTSSYARVMQNEEVKQQVDSIAEPIQRNYQSLIQQLRERNAVGVVVAVNGEMIWADIFASTALLEKYWPKLVRSYAAEAFVTNAKGRETDVKSAQEFLDVMEGRRETVESEPGLYRHTEITGDGFKAFELTALLPKTGFDLHLAKMAE